MKILGVRIDNISLEEAVAKVSRFLTAPSKTTELIGTVNPEMILMAQKNPRLKEALDESFLNVPDGMGVVWAAKKYREKIKNRVTGIDLVENLAKISMAKHWRWYLLGGAPGVAKKAANLLIKKNPGIKIIKAEDGGRIDWNDLSSCAKLVERINKSKPDILVVSFGIPKQEIFIDNFRNKLGTKIAIGAGGTLDFIARKRRRAPILLRKIGLEWLWRLILEPKRLIRIWKAVVVFPLAVKRDIRKIKRTD